MLTLKSQKKIKLLNGIIFISWVVIMRLCRRCKFIMKGKIYEVHTGKISGFRKKALARIFSVLLSFALKLHRLLFPDSLFTFFRRALL